MSATNAKQRLLSTARGRQWLSQFELADQEIARKAVRSLTLVSHNEFERNLISLVEKHAAEENGLVALFAVREICPDAPFFVQSTRDGVVDALSSGVDHGSEARIATIIRNLCKSAPDKFMNHPTIEEMRSRKCGAIFFLDDFIGSGDRVVDFCKAFGWSGLSFRGCRLSIQGSAFSVIQELIVAWPEFWDTKQSRKYFHSGHAQRFEICHGAET